MASSSPSLFCSHEHLEWTQEQLWKAIVDHDLDALQEVVSSSFRLDVNFHPAGHFYTPFYQAVGPSKIHTKMCRVLLEHTNADISLGGERTGVSPLAKACQYENEDLVKVILDKIQVHVPLWQHESILNICAGDRCTPLIRSAKKGNLPIVQLLLEHPVSRGVVNVHHYDQQAMNALMHACTENHYEVAEYLIKNTHLNVNDYKVDTPIWYAAAHGNAKIVELLVQNGAKIEYRREGTIYSSTPLMEACEWGHLEVVKTLLEYGANPTNKTGRKALKLAKEPGYHQVVELMEQWSRRVTGLESVAENGGQASLLPLVLCKAAKRLDLMFRIVRQSGDSICYSRRRRMNEADR
jgi:hypothetical protein